MFREYMIIFFRLKFEDKSYKIQISETPASIGRSSGNTYRLKDPKLSSRHCLLYVKNSILYVEDLDSKNGVYLNGIKVLKQRVYLNDTIQIGDCSLKVDRMKLSEDTLNILGSDKPESREVTLELATPLELEEPKQSRTSSLNKNSSKQKLTDQNKKLYKGLKSIDEEDASKELNKSKKPLFIALILLVLILGLIGNELLS